MDLKLKFQLKVLEIDKQTIWIIYQGQSKLIHTEFNRISQEKSPTVKNNHEQWVLTELFEIRNKNSPCR